MATTLPDAQPIIDGSKYVTVREGSALLGGVVTPETLSRMARRGHLRGAFRAGGKIWLLKASLRDLIEPYADEARSVRQINAAPPPPPVKISRPPKNTFDAPGRVRRI